ncbi:Terpene synthase, partial [Thalictrum thalictroides]
CWLMKDEQIFLDIATCAMAFRILRMHGYDVSSGVLAQYSDREGFASNTLAGYLKDTGAVLELYRASHFVLPDELFQPDLKSWSGEFLKEEQSKGSMHADRLFEYISKEVNVALKYPYYATLQRLENRRNIEHNDTDNFRILKTAYRPINLDKKDIIEFAVEDFNLCQSIHQKELDQLEWWVKENRLDKLSFARQKQVFCYFSAAATIFPPELSDARLSWAKNSTLTIVIDDFYDGEGSKEELLNLIELLERWDGVSATDCCSETVEILFYALRNTINELGEKAIKWQKRDVTRHIVEIWLMLMKAFMKEAEWQLNRMVPTINEYNANAYISIAVGAIVLPSLYFVGPLLSDEVVRTREYHNLFRLMSTCGRNLNDIQGFEREYDQGNCNGVCVLMKHDPDVSTLEEAARKMRAIADSSTKEVMKLVLQTTGSVVPRACKDLFLNTCRIFNLFYANTDGLTSAEEMMGHVMDVLYVPVTIPDECRSD